MSYCAIFERNLGEAIPSSSVSLCKTLLAYSVAEVNGYRYGRCFQRLIRRMFLYFFLPSFFLLFSLSLPLLLFQFVLEERGEGYVYVYRANFRRKDEDRWVSANSSQVCHFFPLVSSQFFPPFFGFAINGERCAAAIHSREVTRGREREVNLAGR